MAKRVVATRFFLYFERSTFLDCDRASTPMRITRCACLAAVCGLVFLSIASAPAGDGLPNKETFSIREPGKYRPPNPPLIGDLGGFNFGGFNFGGGFQGGFQQFGGGFQGGFQQFGGFQQVGGGFQGGFQQFGGFQQVGGGFQGGFQQFGGGQFGGGFQCGGFQLGGCPQGGFQGGLAISPFRGAYKIAESESPTPQDRIYVSYNFFTNVENIANLHRQTFGLEKTFLDQELSLGLRLPFLQTEGSNVPSDHEWGDLSFLVKYALYHNRTSGNLISTGLVVTAPTGPLPASFVLRNNQLELVDSTLLQPFVGYVWNSGDFFVQGFSSVMIPTDSDDVTILFNDIGVGYHIPVNVRFLREVVPVFEIHINTPLTRRDEMDLPRFRDSVNLTGGVHLYFNEDVSLTLGLGTTVTEPRLFDLEGAAALNFRF